MQIKILGFLLAVFSIAIFANCKSRTKNAIEQFNALNDSLKHSSNTIPTTIKTLYAAIDSNRPENVSLAKKADAIVQVLDSLEIFIKQLKLRLSKEDSSGNEMHVAENIFVNTETGTSLGDKIDAVYTTVALSAGDEKAAIDSLMGLEKDFVIDKDWTEKIFKGVPTVAAITLLNKFENDCIAASRFSLTSIKNRLITK